MGILQSQLTEENFNENKLDVVIVKAYRNTVYDLINLNHYQI